jgi:hypothetical protein
MNAAPEPQLLLVTPTYPRPLRLSFLRRCAEDFRGVPNLLWIVVEDDVALAADVERLLAESGVTHIYLAHGPTRSWGNAQRNRALQYIRDHRLTGVVYLADDDNKYQPPLFDELRRIRRVGILPVGCLGPSGIERPVVRGSRIVGWSADWKGRKYPVDMAGFGFNAALLFEMTGDLWAYQGRGGETEFIERLIGLADQPELLCNDCRDCYAWHDLPIGWSTRLGLIAYLVRRRAPAFMRRKLNRAFRKIWLTEGKLWL